MNIWVLLFAFSAAAFAEWYWYKFPPTAKAAYLKNRLLIQLLPVVIYAVVRIILYSAFERFEALKFHFIINAVVLIYYFLRFLWIGIDLTRKIFRKKNSWQAFYWLFVLCFLIFILAWTGYTELFFRVKVQHIQLKSAKMKDDVSVLHVSDLHLGSFIGPRKINKLVRLINTENPDLLCFTGDLVNSDIREAYPYARILKNLTPGSCKVAVLGNHDYGDAYGERDPDKFRPISNEVDSFLRTCGFIVLRDSSFIYVKNNDSIVVAGTNNCGSPPFQSFGDFRKALSFTADKQNLFTLMLTHDPQYWSQTNCFDGRCDLTLSGHTHGGQLGVRLGSRGRVYLSPGALRNSFNGGLYSCKNTTLIVSTGYGNIGLNMRLGIRPEVVAIRISGTRH